MRIYSTKEVAELAQVHPNTVRIYEQWGYISPVERAKNGYRQFEEVHLLQLQVIRLAFRHELVHKDFRKKAIQIVKYSGQQSFKLVLKEAKDYMKHLEKEHKYVLVAIQIAEKWGRHFFEYGSKTYTHQEAAAALGITEEILRNWERNGLFEVERNAKRHRIYYESDMEKLWVIRSLRSANISYSSILRFFQHSDSKKLVDAKHIFNAPNVKDEIIYTTDQLELRIRKAMNDIAKLIEYVQLYIKKGTIIEQLPPINESSLN